MRDRLSHTIGYASLGILAISNGDLRIDTNLQPIPHLSEIIKIIEKVDGPSRGQKDDPQLGSSKIADGNLTD